MYYVRSDGAEVVADALDFEVAGALTNSVELWSSRSKVQPEQEMLVFCAVLVKLEFSPVGRKEKGLGERPQSRYLCFVSGKNHHAKVTSYVLDVACSD